MNQQQQMNMQQLLNCPQPLNPLGLYMPPPVPVRADPISTLLITVGRPNCGWLRRLLWGEKALGRIQSYEESSGWLIRSFSIVGRKSALNALWAHLREIMPEEPE